MNETQARLYNKAIIFAAEAHTGQFRKYSGEPYILHPLDVAETLRRYDRPIEEIVGGVLHDVIEDTNRTRNQVSFHFGIPITTLVNGVTNVATDKNVDRTLRFWQNVFHLEDAEEGSQNIKCADIYSNTKNFGRANPEFVPTYMAEKYTVLEHLHVADSCLVTLAKESIMQQLTGRVADWKSEMHRLEKARPRR